ncbi:MAG: carbohydrate binding domain-containing protein, partial [Candidatus Hadarchaeales archaeon]
MSRIAFCCSIAILLVLLINSTAISAADLVYDDFNDGEAGTNQGGLVGTMSPDLNGDNVGEYDPTVNFTNDSYEGSFALSLTYSMPSGQWCGYWSYANDTDPNSPPQSTIDVSGYGELRFAARGTKGNEQIKVELTSSSSEASYKYVTVPGTSWGEIVIKLTELTKVPWIPNPVNLSALRQINFIFDRSPYSSTVYLDYIRFTGGTSALQNPTASFTYSPASP